MASPAVAHETPPGWPPVVIGSLFARRRVVGAQARGRVLDLGAAGPPLDSYDRDAVESVTVIDPDVERCARRRAQARRIGLTLIACASLDELPVAVEDGGAFDTVVSVLGLAACADLPRSLSALTAPLHRDGSLVLVEPTLATGAAAALTTPLVALVPGLGSQHLNRDVPSAVRAHGLTVVAIERFTMPTLIWPLRSFAQATARWSASSPEADGR